MRTPRRLRLWTQCNHKRNCPVRFLFPAFVTIFLTAVCLSILHQYPPLLSSQSYQWEHSEAQPPQQNVSSVPKREDRKATYKLDCSEDPYIILERTSPCYKKWKTVSWSWTCPSSIIWKPGVFIGNCWAFEGDYGHMVIRLVGRVLLTHITLQHPSPTVAHTGGTTSAPRELEIFGLQANNTEVFLGKFIFDVQKSEVETFQLQNDPPSAFPEVKIQVLSNGGNPHITVLYKVHLHGVQIPKLADDNAMEVTGEPH